VDCLADEDFSLDAERRLRVSGHAVAAVVQDRPGSPDEEVLGRAAREDRAVLTFDRDHGRLLFGETGKPVPPGIVYFRFDPSPPEEPADLPLAPLEQADFSVAGVLTVVERDRVRQRPLPEAR
jgi:predicted nuclease of predicted toxin-antitoxin system